MHFFTSTANPIFPSLFTELTLCFAVNCEWQQLQSSMERDVTEHIGQT